MALSSGASGATGFAAFGTGGKKSREIQIRLGRLLELNREELLL